MIRLMALLLPMTLASCLYGPGDPPSVPPLAEDQGQPGPALAEHVLTAHFVENAATPTVCIAMAPQPFTDREERSLIARFPRLSPLDRCKPSGSAFVDVQTQGPAQLLQLYAFACDSPTSCSGWANVPGHPSTRYRMRWQDGRWHFAADLRLIER